MKCDKHNMKIVIKIMKYDKNNMTIIIKIIM